MTYLAFLIFITAVIYLVGHRFQTGMSRRQGYQTKIHFHLHHLTFDDSFQTLITLIAMPLKYLKVLINISHHKILTAGLSSKNVL